MKVLKQKKLPEITYNEWMQALNVANSIDDDPIPEGYKTFKGVAEILGLGETRTRKNLKKMIAAKMVDKKTIWRADKMGRPRPFHVYKLLSTTPKP